MVLIIGNCYRAMVLGLETLLLMSIKGKVVEQAIDGVKECLKGLAKKYLGIGKYYYRKPNYERMILIIKSERIIVSISIHPAFYFLVRYMTRMITNISIQINQI
jgi:hypothetical protein